VNEGPVARKILAHSGRGREASRGW
jgi:hypothetical protein